MSNIFANTKPVNNEVEEDFMGGGGLFETDLYTGKIKVAYLLKASKSDAQSVNLVVDIAGKEYKSQTWVSNKTGGVTYKDKKTNEDRNLPGYNMMSSLMMLGASMELNDPAVNVEERTVKIYDYDAKKELPKAVSCFVDLHDVEIGIAIQKQTVDKTKKNDNSGVYEPTGETRDQNETVKFFDPEKFLTISEIDQHIKSLGGTLGDVLSSGDLDKAVASMKVEDDRGAYATAWSDKNKGQTYNKAKGGAKEEGKSFGGGEAKKEKAASLFD